MVVGNHGLSHRWKESETYLGSVSHAVLTAKQMNCLFVA